MNIWVDADACPVVIRDILFKAAQRRGVQLTLIANHALPVPKHPLISMRQVASGFDVADDEIVQRCEADDLVITSDIPLADEVLQKRALVLTPRGERYTQDNIKSRLNMRDFMESMRASGIQSGGQKPYGAPEKQKFSNELDRILTTGKK